MEPEFIKDIGISPFAQKLVLARAQPGGPSFVHFGLVGRSPEFIKAGHETAGKVRKTGIRFCRHQRQKLPIAAISSAGMDTGASVEASSRARKISVASSQPSARRIGGFMVPWNPYLRGVLVMSSISSEPGLSSSPAAGNGNATAATLSQPSHRLARKKAATAGQAADRITGKI